MDGAIPCEVTVDEENGRYMLRKADTSGEVFNDAQDLLQWIEQNWKAEQFSDPHAYKEMIEKLHQHILTARNV